jgi:pimeloyl-ACP methyl ester carboxylesterase
MKLKRPALRGLRKPAVVLVMAVAALVAIPTFAIAQSSHSGKAFPVSRGPKPTIVLVHGAWADASSWDKVIPILQREGYTVDAPPNPLRGLPSDSAYLASYLSTISGAIVLRTFLWGRSHHQRRHGKPEREGPRLRGRI